ncbi:MAG: glycosyltransferase, partial [Lachnospiraceae bacterium]|nr:glycosyltransferase [Lachnospiraceae bacterium]
MYKVAVLMSTYNGEKFIRDQVDSILNQAGVEVTLYVRDDGSTDRTAELIKDVPGVKLTAGENVGVGNSFMQMVYDVPTTFDYYAFADQDDCWLSDKLMNAIYKIGDTDELKLYASNQTLVNASLDVIRDRYSTPPDYSYMQTICANRLAGCTFVWNNAFHNLISTFD